MARNILEFRRDPTGVVFFVRHDGDAIGRIADEQLWNLLRYNLLTSRDEAIRGIIHYIGNALYPGDRLWTDSGSRDNARIVDRGQQWAARMEADDVWTLDVRDGVTLTISRDRQPLYNERGLTVGVTFADVREATTFELAARKCLDQRGIGSIGTYVEIVSVTYESAFFVRSKAIGHFTFARGTSERLGARLTKVDGDWHRIAPLDGEILVVYGGNSLSLGWGPDYVQHPEHDVFASVGLFSFRLVQSDSMRVYNGFANYHVATYLDPKLPIAPQEPGGYDGDIDCDGYSPFGYEEEY